jgi:hypothetical protein
MATSITGGDLKLVADKAVSNVGNILLPAKSFSLGVQTSGMSKGDSTQVFVAGAAPDAEAFDVEDNNYMTDNGGDHAWKPITLDQHIKLTFKILPHIFEKLSADSMAALYKPYVSKVADKVISDVFAKITNANFPTSLSVSDAGAFSKTNVSKAETELAKLVGVGGERNLVLSVEVFDALRDSLTGIYATPTNNDVLRNGTIPGLGGFANILRTTAIKPGTGTYMFGMATNMSGIALATSAVRQVPQFDGEVEVAVDSDGAGNGTGIPLTFSVDYSKETRAFVATVEILYGIAVLDKKGILRLTTTASAGA